MGRKALPKDEMNLTERERSMLEYMKSITLEKGYPPTVREICTVLNIKSTSTAHKDLASLEAKGFIRKDPSKPRAIEILDFDRAKEQNESEKKGLPNNEYVGLSESIVEVPIVGRIAAGTPILAEQNIDETFPLPSRFINTGANHFMLVVRGESMIEVGIFDGDYILVKQQNEAVNGDIVVAMIDGFESEATVKTFYKEKGYIRLQPENAAMSPIIVDDVKVLGIVKGVFRYFQ